MISARGLVKRFGEQTVLDGVDLEVEPGSVHFILGRSGVGKSVLIKHVVGLLAPSAGSLTFNGQEVASLDRASLRQLRMRCQLIFQHPALFEQLTVLENVAMPLRKRFQWSGRQADVAARSVLATLDVDGFAERRPVELGTGVQKRISVARALALEPEVLLYDEPTTALDPVAARRLDHVIRQASDTRGLTSVVVSHDLESVAAIADRVTFLEAGRVAFDGSREAWLSCALPTVQAFKGGGARWRP